MGSHSSSALRRVWLMGIVFACLLTAMCGVKPAKSSAVEPDSIRVVYKYNNGMASTVATGTIPMYLGLPDNPTFGKRLFLGWMTRSENGDTNFFSWDWLTASQSAQSPKSSPSNLVTHYTPTNVQISSDTTVSAQWANVYHASLNTTYQHMLSQNSPLWKKHPVAVYSRTLTAGVTYHIQTWLPGGDSHLYLFDDALKLLLEDNDGNTNSSYLSDRGSYVKFTPTKTGTYYFFDTTHTEYSPPFDHGMSFFRIGTAFIAEPQVCVTWISSGTTIARTYYAPGEKVTSLGTPKRKGYSFVGWYSDAALTKRVDFSNFLMPTSDVNFYAKWTSNECQLRGLAKSSGTLTQHWTRTNYINRLRISRYTSRVTIRPLRYTSRSKIFIKTQEGTYKAMSSIKVTLKRGETKTIYIKCVSQTGSRYMSIYKVFVTRNR